MVENSEMLFLHHKVILGVMDLGRQQWCLLLGVLPSFPTSLLPKREEPEISDYSASMLQRTIEIPCSSLVSQTGYSQGLETLRTSILTPKVLVYGRLLP